MYFYVEYRPFVSVGVTLLQVSQALAGHHDFLDLYKHKGSLMFSGTYPSHGGGFMLFKADSIDDVQSCVQNDPLLYLGIQKCTITPFSPDDSTEFVLNLWNNTNVQCE